MPCLIEKLQKMEIKMENGRLKDLLEKNSILVAPPPLIWSLQR